MMSEEMIFELVSEFLAEAFEVLKVPEADRLRCVRMPENMISDGKYNPIRINAVKKQLVMRPALFRIMSGGGYKPTPLRLITYSFAIRWRMYLDTGQLTECYEEEKIGGYAIATMKGLQLYMKEESTDPKRSAELLHSNLKGTTHSFGFNPPFELVRKMIYQLSGVSTELQEVKTHNSSKFVDFVCVKPTSRVAYAEKVYELMKGESISVKPLGSLAEGEKGTESNPFENVDEAANYIKELEKFRLAGDQYRSFIINEPYFIDPNMRSFRIPWSSPRVAYMDGANVIKDGFVVNQVECRDKTLPYPYRFNFKPCLCDHKFLFRGQAEYYSPCVPNIFRKKEEDYFLKYNIFTYEMRLLLESHPLVKLFNNGVTLFNDNFPFEVNYGGLSQHYYNRTQFLDLTSQIDTAKFFAVTTFDFDNNKYVPYTGSKLGVLYYFDIEPDAFLNHIPEKGYQLSSIGKQPFMRSGAQHGFLLLMGKGLDFNKLPQVRTVFFKHDKAVTERIYRESKQGDIYQAEDILQDYWLRKLKDPKLNNRVCMRAVEENQKDNPDKSVGELIEILKKDGITVHNDGFPKFDDLSLDKFYYNHIDEYWADFCSNIYFYSPEGRILKEYLLNLPNDTAYRQFFRKI